MDAEFVNVYIENLNNELTDLTKQKIILKTQLAFQEKLVASLASQVEELQKALDKANAKKKKEEI
jgi:septal ring factor EnvC (AmiA/AmiB activator)